MFESRVLTLKQSARLLRVSETDIDTEIAAGRLAAVRIGRKRRIVRADLDAFLVAQGGSPFRQRRPRWPVAPVAAMSVAAGLAWAAVDFPFPDWSPVEIPPQQALFVDPDEPAQPEPEGFAPINAPLDYRRFNAAPNPESSGATHMLMSLQHQNRVPPDSLSFPWAFFVNLDTNHDRGDGVGSIINLWNRGSGWSSAYHADVFAVGDGPAIGANIETLDLGEERAYVVGVNVQNKAHRANVGMQVQTGPLPESHRWWEPGMDGGWLTGFRLAGMPGAGYYRTGIEFDRHTHGRRGIWMRGQFDTGIDLGGNSLRMNEGARLELDADSAIALRFNRERERIEFLEGNSVIAWIDVGARDINLAR